MMATLRERIAGERGRLKQVRQALTAAAAKPSAGGEDRSEFYMAIGDYFEASMDRLHEQDIRLGDMLRDKADMTTADNQQALAELDERLSGNQMHLKNMLAARDDLRSSGASAQVQFESAGGAYARYIVENMGHHPGTTDLARELFSMEDWEYMAFASEEAQAREQQLHAHVFQCVPSDLTIDPES